MVLPFFIPVLILTILKKESPPGQQDSKVVRTLLLLSVFISTVVSVLFCAGTTDAAFGMRYAFLSFNTVFGISVFLRFSMPHYWSLSVVVLYLIQLGWAFERFFANPGM
jgi:ABC-type sugar transport system permease subunit